MKKPFNARVLLARIWTYVELGLLSRAPVRALAEHACKVVMIPNVKLRQSVSLDE